MKKIKLKKPLDYDNFLIKKIKLKEPLEIDKILIKKDILGRIEIRIPFDLFGKISIIYTDFPKNVDIAHSNLL